MNSSLFLNYGSIEHVVLLISRQQCSRQAQRCRVVSFELKMELKHPHDMGGCWWVLNWDSQSYHGWCQPSQFSWLLCAHSRYLIWLTNILQLCDQLLLGQRSRCHILSSSIQKKLDLLIDFHQILLDVFFGREACSASYGDLTFLCNCRPYYLVYKHRNQWNCLHQVKYQRLLCQQCFCFCCYLLAVLCCPCFHLFCFVLKRTLMQKLKLLAKIVLKYPKLRRSGPQYA